MAIVAEDADLVEAAEMICASKLFDYATSCSSENAVIAVADVYERFMEEMLAHGCHLVGGANRETLRNHMWKVNAKGKLALNPGVIAKSAQVIADGAGISIPDGTDILLVEGREPIAQDKFHDEKISPVLTIYKAADFQDAYRILTELTSRVGRGHSCGIHTWRRDYIDYLGTAHENLAGDRAPCHERGQRRASLQPHAVHGHSGLRHLGRQHHHGKRPLETVYQCDLGQ